MSTHSAVVDVDADASRISEEARNVSRRAARRSLLVGLTVLLLTVVAVASWAAYEARRLQREAGAAVDPLRRLDASPRALAGDRELMEQSTRHARAATHAADSLPLRVASRLPFVGDDVRAARTLATSLDVVVNRAGLPVTGVLERVVAQPTRAPAGALVDTAALDTAGPTVDAAAEVVHDARTRLGAIDTGSLVGPVRRDVQEAARRLMPVDTTLTEASAHLPALAGLLGASGPRQYLLVFQNLAEARPTGGIIGKWATVDVDRAAIRMTGIGTNEDLSSLTLRNLPVMPPDFTGMYGRSLGPLANANLSPDFPSAARMIMATWRQQGHPAPAGVISVNTRAIAAMLTLTGPVRVQGPKGIVTVSAGNVVDIVQNRVYGWFDRKETQRQQFLSALTSTTFNRLTKGNLATQDLAATVQSLVTSHDVMAYATEPALQRALSSLGASGALPHPTVDSTLVHLTDNGGSKLDNYLTTATCGSPARVALKVTNTLPRNYASFVPAYAQNQRSGTPGGTNLLTASVYLPAGRGMSRATVNGHVVRVAAGTEKGWSVVRIPLSVPAASSVRVVLTLSGTGPAPDVTTQTLTNAPASNPAMCGK